jgi:hypothetical protein
MAVKITIFHEWLRKYPKNDWGAIKDNLYTYGELPKDAKDKFRLVRVMSGKGAKIGLVAAKDAPHIGEDQILWLRTARKLGKPHYFMRATSGWAGKVRGIIRYYTEDGGFGMGHQSDLPDGLP